MSNSVQTEDNLISIFASIIIVIRNKPWLGNIMAFQSVLQIMLLYCFDLITWQ